MPYGTARIIGDTGAIDTDPPSPVYFIASNFPDVHDGNWVYFERRISDPTRASTVQRAAHQLVALATPDHGVTRAAKRLLEALAEDALTPLQAEELERPAKLAAWEELRMRMDAVATAAADRPKPAGVARIRASFAKTA